MSGVIDLATALIGYRGLKLEEIIKLLTDSVVVLSNGEKAVELAIFEEKVGLPDNFFANAIKKEPPLRQQRRHQKQSMDIQRIKYIISNHLIGINYKNISVYWRR